MKYYLYPVLLILFISASCQSPSSQVEMAPAKLISNEQLQAKVRFFKSDTLEWFLFTDDGVPLYVKEVGKGETIVALHGGFGMEYSYMQGMLQRYEKDFKLVYYDQRGSLRSKIPNDDYDKYITLDNMVEDLELLRKELGQTQLNLIAHSMGAVLTYEYMKKYPNNVKNIVIVSGFAPKFPETQADFYKMFKSQDERAEFMDRPEIHQELDVVKNSKVSGSRITRYFDFRINSSGGQFYNVDNWKNAKCGLGFFNPKMNEIIGPESNISLVYMYYFWKFQNKYYDGELDANNYEHEVDAPVNYMPVIAQHKEKIHYMMGRYEVGDWMLRQYETLFTGVENAELHIFEKSGHMVWIDQPEAFHETLGDILSTWKGVEQLAQR